MTNSNENGDLGPIAKYNDLEIEAVAQEVQSCIAHHAENRIDYALRLGALLSRARALHPSDELFGKWVSTTIVPTPHKNTVTNYLTFYETLGHIDPAVLGLIGLTNCYNLASMDEDARKEALKEVGSGEPLKSDAMKEIKREFDGRKPSPLKATRKPKSVDQKAAGYFVSDEDVSLLESILDSETFQSSADDEIKKLRDLLIKIMKTAKPELGEAA